MTQNESQKKSKFKSATLESAVFNRELVRKNRDRAATQFAEHDFLVHEITARMMDNLQDVRRDFKHVVAIGGDRQLIADHLKAIEIIYQDLSLKMLRGSNGQVLQADEEFFPYQNQCLDLVLSCLSLHSANDLPGALVQFLQSLKPDGMFLATLFGGQTLSELRKSMMDAEMEFRGGVSPHVSPFMDVRDAGSLLQRAGFALPVATAETVTVTYSDAFALMKELKAMGEQSSLIKRFKGLTRPEYMMKVAEKYHQMYANDKGRIPATFEILYLQGWAPHESQQKPLKPGSAKMALKDALGVKPPSL